MMLSEAAICCEKIRNKSMFFYYAKIVEHIAQVLRDSGHDGDQADQLALELSNCNSDLSRK